MSDEERAQTILTLLRKEYPDVKGTALNFNNTLELLVATILSAQCTDKRVNEVTEILFKKYKTAEDYAEAELEELEILKNKTSSSTATVNLCILQKNRV